MLRLFSAPALARSTTVFRARLGPQFSSTNSIETDNNAVADRTGSKVAVVEHPYSLRGYVPYGTNRQLVEERTNDIFAVVEFSGTQYKVTNDDTIVADLMHDVDIGDEVAMPKVLLVGSKAATIVGQPLIAGAQVRAMVEEITKDKKVTTLKVRRRKNSRNKQGFRRQVTVLRIADIDIGDAALLDELRRPLQHTSASTSTIDTSD